MIQVLHISAECYPAAKTGGLADVVGSLPKYLSQDGILSGAIIPKYDLKWIRSREWITVYGGEVWVNWRRRRFTVQQEAGDSLGYPLFVVDIPGLYDRPGIYNDPSGRPYGDEVERYMTFQQAVLDWLLSFPWTDRPRVLHCHDHHTALIPWMLKFCPAYQELSPIPTVFTIHNAQYQGAFSWQSSNLLPPYRSQGAPLVDWNNTINPMASAVRCAWAVTTVSQSYLYELHDSSLGLERLFRDEWQKEYGIVNGIDAEVWDPATDPMVQHRLEGRDVESFKAKNKQQLCEWFQLPEDQPLISFIGRLVGEKGVDLLPDAIRNFLNMGGQASFLVLGSGESWTENQFRNMAYHYAGRFNAVIDYNEALSHQIYAGSDFLIMPSRVEPCGLNQMYAMRYGTVPIVRAVGGLKDTVADIGEPGGVGRGIRFDQATTGDIGYALHRASSMYHEHPDIMAVIRERIMAVDFSWEKSIEKYLQVYRWVGAQVGPVRPAVDTAPIAPAKTKPPTPKVSAVDQLPTDRKTGQAPAKAKPSFSKKGTVKKNAEPVNIEAISPIQAEIPVPAAKKVEKNRPVKAKQSRKSAGDIGTNFKDKAKKALQIEPPNPKAPMPAPRETLKNAPTTGKKTNLKK